MNLGDLVRTGVSPFEKLPGFQGFPRGRVPANLFNGLGANSFTHAEMKPHHLGTILEINGEFVRVITSEGGVGWVHTSFLEVVE